MKLTDEETYTLEAVADSEALGALQKLFDGLVHKTITELLATPASDGHALLEAKLKHQHTAWATRTVMDYLSNLKKRRPRR